MLLFDLKVMAIYFYPCCTFGWKILFGIYTIVLVDQQSQTFLSDFICLIILHHRKNILMLKVKYFKGLAPIIYGLHFKTAIKYISIQQY